MVQILRPQARQYAADQTDAIRTGQVAKNIGEWNQVIQGAGKIASSIVESRRKEAEEADIDIINTQISSKPETDLLEWNYRQITNGKDPSTEKYTQELYAKRDELYQSYIDQMSSEKGRNLLQQRGLEAAEKIRRANIGKIAKNRQKAQAQVAYTDVLNNMSNEAREFGKLGDWEGFKEATAEDKKALVKYGKANNVKGGSEFEIDMDNIKNFALGQAETNPEEILKVYGTKEDYAEVKKKEIKDKMPQLSDKEADEIFNAMYEKEKIGDYSLEQQSSILPEGVKKQVSDAFVFSKKQEQLSIKEQMKDLPKNSKAHQSFQKRLDEIQEQIDNPEKYVIDILTSDIKKAVVPIAKEKFEANRLLEQKIQQESIKDTYTMVLNPDTSVSLQAQMALSLGQPAVENLFQQSVSDEEMHKAYDAYAQAKTNVLTRQYATVEATEAVADKLYKFLSNPSENDIVMIKDGLELLTEMHKADLTQDQWEDLNNVMYGALKDRKFADLSSDVLEDNNRYFPDLPLVFSLGSQDIAPQSAPEVAGLQSNVLYKSTLGAVKTYLDKESIRISKDAMAMLGQVAQLPTAEQRAEGVNQVQNYVASEKKKVYDNAMKSYGIDLAKLRENKRNFGQAFTQIGRNTVEYMGDDPYSNEPLFRPLTDYTAISNARKRILEGLESSKKSSEEKGK